MFRVGCLTDISFGILLGNMNKILFFYITYIFCFHFHQELKIVIEEFCPMAHVPLSIFNLFYTEPNQNCNFFLMPIH